MLYEYNLMYICLGLNINIKKIFKLLYYNRMTLNSSILKNLFKTEQSLSQSFFCFLIKVYAVCYIIYYFQFLFQIRYILK